MDSTLRIFRNGTSDGFSSGGAPTKCPLPISQLATATRLEPTGGFENNPNVTDKKFPGNPTRSFRTQAPLKIVGEITDWVKQTPEDIQHWRD